MFRESEAELFYDELRLKENRIAELEMRTPKKTDDDKRYAKETGVFINFCIFLSAEPISVFFAA